MTQHSLNGAQISAIHQQIGRKAVSHRVRRNVLGDSSESCVFVDHSLNGSRSDSAIISIGRRLFVAPRIIDEERNQVVVSSF